MCIVLEVKSLAQRERTLDLVKRIHESEITVLLHKATLAKLSWCTSGWRIYGAGLRYDGTHGRFRATRPIEILITG